MRRTSGRGGGCRCSIVLLTLTSFCLPSFPLNLLLTHLLPHPQELLARYSPLHDLTEQERVKATARRVGLDVPQLYDPEAEAEKESSAKKAIDRKAQTLGRTGGTGPLPPPDLD